MKYGASNARAVLFLQEDTQAASFFLLCTQALDSGPLQGLVTHSSQCGQKCVFTPWVSPIAFFTYVPLP